MIEDTTFLIDVLNGDNGAIERVEQLEAERRPEKVAAIPVLELHEGIERSDRPEAEKREVLDVLDSKGIVPADTPIMRGAGSLSGRLASRGERIDREDCLLPETARQEQEPVLTRNVDHFDRVPDVEVITYEPT